MKSGENRLKSTENPATFFDNLGQEFTPDQQAGKF
jgi:hypothetical protein